MDRDPEARESDSEEYYDICYDLSQTCGLCRFSFEDGESVIVFVDENDEPGCAYLEPQRSTWWFEDQREGIFAAADTYHPMCVDLVAPDIVAFQKMGPDIIAMTGHKPTNQCVPACYTRRRRQWLERTFSDNLSQALCGRLPSDICWNIASYCAKERAVQVVQSLWASSDRAQPGRISMTCQPRTGLWVQYTRFEGNRYIKSFSYTSRGGDEVKLIAKEQTGPLNIFVRHTHLGVLDIITTGNNNKPSFSEEGWYWWTIYPQQMFPFYLGAKFDGIKIRSINISASIFSPPPCAPATRWSAIPSSLIQMPQPPFAPMDKRTGMVQAVDLNKPGTSGYSFCLPSCEAFYKFFAHESGTSLTYSRDLFDRTWWIYVPMKRDERIIEIWMRKCELPYERPRFPEVLHKTLILVTDQGKHVVLGNQFDSKAFSNSKSLPTYKMIAKLPQDRPCRMLYATNFWSSRTWCHFEEIYVSENPESRIFPSISPWSPEIQAFNEPYYYTSAKLDGVSEVTPCLDWNHCDAIVGLLLTYTDRRQASVGQILLDHLGAPQTVTSETMWLGYREAEDSTDSHHPPGRPRIHWVGFTDPTLHSGNARGFVEETGEEDKPDQGDNLTKYMMVPLRGRLDWAISESAYCWSHHDNDEPEDEMRSVLHHNSLSGGAQQLDPVLQPLSFQQCMIREGIEHQTQA
ncbi:hypothetical protein FLONG3_9565 [Fusarium longipes]|uniref:Uncharacterized protein n=1 Tax=Fusarium longipes TaxID=694270 RepID=A0A395RW47_9HYPO|nr:hypothetical protein FLONG3_9565 [Fusarium longipes]